MSEPTIPSAVTLLLGRSPRPLPALIDGAAAAYRTDDDQTLLLLPGSSERAPAQLAAAIGMDIPFIACDHYRTVAADPTSGVAAAFHGWVTLETTTELQLPLIDYNVAETISGIRDLPGFRSASFFLRGDRPVVHELVIWETAQHFDAARERPEFTRHMPRVAEMATATWCGLTPLVNPRAVGHADRCRSSGEAAGQ